MNARRRLNQAYVQGSFVLAAIVGYACGSWAVFWITVLILSGMSVYSGEIRPASRPSRKKPPRRDRFRGDHFQ